MDDTSQMLKMKLDKGDVIKNGGEKKVYLLSDCFVYLFIRLLVA